MFARTQRLLLRPPWPEDAPAITRALGDKAVACNLARAPWPYRTEHALEFIRAQRPVTEPAFLAFLRTNGAPMLVGGAGLGRDPEGNVELGYWIAKPFWGLGFATEAAAAIVEIAREGLRLRKLVAGHFLDNPSSGRVLEKLGFTPTGRVISRYSVGRREAARCRLYELRLDQEDDMGMFVPPAVRTCSEALFA